MSLLTVKSAFVIADVDYTNPITIKITSPDSN